MATWTPKKIKALKGKEKFATITAYDAITASTTWPMKILSSLVLFLRFRSVKFYRNAHFFHFLLDKFLLLR